MTESKTITFGAVGDVGFWKGVNDGARRHGLDWPFARMKSQLDRADVLFGNMETVVAPPDYPKSEIDPHGLVAPFAGKDVAAALKRAGFDFMNLASNHVLDAGVLGMDTTKAVLEEAGIVTAGVGHTQEDARALATLEKDGITFGFLCYSEDCNYTLGTRGPCFAYYERDTVLADVAKHKDAVDVLVVSIHADIEFMPVPSVPRRNNFRDIAKAGANIILGHHPHVPQGCEMVDGCLVAYSLGNFVFPAHTSAYMKGRAPNTGRSFMLLAEVSKAGVQSFERVPFVINEPPEERPAPMEAAARDDMLKYLADLDAKLSDETFMRETWREVARRHLGIYLSRAMEAPDASPWKRAVRKLLDRMGFALKPNIDRVIDEFVGRLCLTAENRNWMQEVLAMGREKWDERNSAPPDAKHRPHYRYEHKK